MRGREGEAPKLYLHGNHTYEATLNTENALGTIASIEYVLRHLDRYAGEEQAEIELKFSNFDKAHVLPGLYTYAVQPLMLLTPPHARAATCGAYTIATHAELKLPPEKV